MECICVIELADGLHAAAYSLGAGSVLVVSTRCIPHAVL